VLAEAASTNDLAKQAAKEGAPHGSVWICEAQTAGRGRQGRAWTSPRGENILASVLARVACAPARLPSLSLAAGLSVRDVVAEVLPDRDVRVKWPNDVVVGPYPRHRKIAGILVEATLAGSKADFVIVGIGLNVHTRVFPDGIASVATSCALEGGTALDRAEILADVVAALDRDLSHVAAFGLGLVRARLERADLLRGHRVSGDAGLGICEGIDDDGRLLVRGDDGIVRRWSSGEVTAGAQPRST
jgi:BirA family biotin operon repressor/biotin-[acetyl-CoA-carboxylase] ligase